MGSGSSHKLHRSNTHPAPKPTKPHANANNGDKPIRKNGRSEPDDAGDAPHGFLIKAGPLEIFKAQEKPSDLGTFNG